MQKDALLNCEGLKGENTAAYWQVHFGGSVLILHNFPRYLPPVALVNRMSNFLKILPDSKIEKNISPKFRTF